jgi:large subunit ribosomal protein L13
MKVNIPFTKTLTNWDKLFIFAFLIRITNELTIIKAGIMGTYSAKQEDIKRSWHVVDANGKTLGRLATAVASVLKGKNKPIYTKHIDTGDFVIVVNADRVHLTGKKLDQKTYYSHSGFPGGLKSVTAGTLMKSNPEEVIKKAVEGMLPKTRLGKQMLSKLKVYAGEQHPHSAQQPSAMTIK